MVDCAARTIGYLLYLYNDVTNCAFLVLIAMKNCHILRAAFCVMHYTAPPTAFSTLDVYAVQVRACTLWKYGRARNKQLKSKMVSKPHDAEGMWVPYLKSQILKLQGTIYMLYKTNKECFHSCNRAIIFIRWKIETFYSTRQCLVE